MRRRVRGTTAAAAFLLVACLAWVAWVPYSPRRVLRVLPADVNWVSAHDALGRRWPGLAENPILGSLLPGPSSPKPGNRTARLYRLLRRTASRRTYVASVSYLGPSGESALIASTWVGALGHFARWWLLRFPPAGIHSHEPVPGRMYWSVDRPELAGGTASFAIEDGVLFGSFARRHDAITGLFAAADENALSLAYAGWTSGERDWLVDNACPDRAWVRMTTLSPTVGFSPVQLEMVACSADELRLNLRWSASSSTGDPSAQRAETPPFSVPWGDLPVGVAEVHRCFLEELFFAWMEEPWMRETSALLDHFDVSRMTIGLFGGREGGRLHGLRVPALVAAIPLTEPRDALRVFADWLPRLGRGAAFSPVLAPATADSGGWRRIDDAEGQSSYGRLANGEKGVAAVWGNGFLVATHPAPLEAIRRLRPGSDPSVTGFELTAAFPDPAERGTIFSGRLDLRHGGKALRNGLAVWSLGLMADPATANLSLQRHIEYARRALEAAAPMGRLRMKCIRIEDVVALQIRIGG